MNRILLDRTVLVGALGYFVDSFDILLFSAVRSTSLKDLGVTQDNLMKVGLQVLDWQMAGMLLGGLLWGILGDRLGRRTVLFGSIVLYSLATLANAAVTSVPLYAALRFVAGLGLAGEVGAAVTLVCERLTKEDRGYGTMLLAGVGVMGAMTAGLVGDLLPWRHAYVLGGLLGLVLLVLRAGTPESGLFQALASPGGDLRLLAQRWKLYLRCILLGVPIWFTVAVFVTLMPELARQLQCTGPILAGRAVFWCYVGAVVGDLASGWASQVWRSRRKALAVWLALLNLTACGLVLTRGLTPQAIYGAIFLLGVFTGYWAVLITVAAEQFGTNLRATVATSVPNFVRGSTVLSTALFWQLSRTTGALPAAALVLLGLSALAFASLAGLRESYGLELDYLEA